MIDAPRRQLTDKELRKLRDYNAKRMGGEIPFVTRPYEKQLSGRNISILKKGLVGISDIFDYNVQKRHLFAVGEEGNEDNEATNRTSIKLNVKPPEQKVSEPLINNEVGFFEYIGLKIKQILGKRT